MYQVRKKINLPVKSDELSNILRNLHSLNLHAEFYLRASHQNTDDGDIRTVDGKLILSRRADFVVHDNPWAEDGDEYHASISMGGTDQYFYIPKDTLRGRRMTEYLWVRHLEVHHVEMRYLPTSNKEAVGALERYDE